MARRAACIDIGSNSVRLMVMDLTRDGPRLLLSDGRMTRLADALVDGGSLRGVPLDRTASAVREFAASAREWEAEPVCIATAAVRDAPNGEQVRSLLSDVAGSCVRALTGREEAELGFIGARVGSASPPDAFTSIDIGGGSTDIAWGGEHMVDGISFPQGSRRLLAVEPDLGAEGPIEEDRLRCARRRVVEQLAAGVGDAGPPRGNAVVGTGGTVAALAALTHPDAPTASDALNDKVLSREDLTHLRGRLAGMSLIERRDAMTEPRRGDLILPGLVILEAALEWLGARSLVVSVYGLRLGAVTREGERLLSLTRTASPR